MGWVPGLLFLRDRHRKKRPAGKLNIIKAGPGLNRSGFIQVNNTNRIRAEVIIIFKNLFFIPY